MLAGLLVAYWAAPFKLAWVEGPVVVRGAWFSLKGTAIRYRPWAYDDGFSVLEVEVDYDGDGRLDCVERDHDPRTGRPFSRWIRPGTEASVARFGTPELCLDRARLEP